MKLIATLVVATGMCAAAPAFSAPVTINFEGTTSFSSINNFYNGGTDAAGATGANYGISFSGSATALDGTDGTLATPFTAPSGTNVMFAPDTPAVMNVASGFYGNVGFSYSSVANSTQVKVWDGLNATGNVLSTFTLGANSAAFELFSAVSQGFSGVGYSISFGDNTGLIAYDDVSVNAVPLPAAALLFPLGAAGLGMIGRRRSGRAA